MNTGPVLIVNDDLDDQEFFKEAWEELEYTNPLKFFTNAEEVVNYLRQEKTVPFLIISDLYMHNMNGFELKKKLLEDRSINYKTIPFVFFSDAASNSQIEKSYDLGSHGFFIKEKNIKDIKSTLADIVKYWQKSKTPQ